MGGELKASVYIRMESGESFAFAGISFLSQQWLIVLRMIRQSVVAL
jgi:hypothetical protein